MKAWGFVGSSGTGKSHRALEVAKMNGFSFIIDDGLLIKENMVLAGTSAKRELSKIASVRRALFMESEHAQTVIKAIKNAKAESILILGTSNQMVEAIAAKLELPPISRFIYIQDVASQEEINTAVNIRRGEGKHVIPAPTFAIKKEFSGYFLDPLKRLPIGRKKTHAIEDRTIVRPTFSYLGNFTISKAAIEQLVCHISGMVPNVEKVLEIKSDFSEAGLILELQLAIKYGCKIHHVLEDTLKCINQEIDKQTALNLLGVDVTAKALVL